MHIDEFTNLLKGWLRATNLTSKLVAFEEVSRYKNHSGVIRNVGSSYAKGLHKDVDMSWFVSPMHQQVQVAKVKELLSFLTELSIVVNNNDEELICSTAAVRSAAKAAKTAQLMAALNTAKSVKDLIDSGVIVTNEANGFRGYVFSARVAEEIVDAGLATLGDEWHIRHLTAPFGMVEVAKAYQKPHDNVTFYSGWIKNI
jgi:hypothetical protein